MLLPTREIVRGELLIRPFEIADAAALVESVTESLEHLRPWMPWIAQEPVSLGARRAFIERGRKAWAGGGDMIWGIFLGDKLVGSCGLHRRIGPTGLEIGYWIHADYCGRGFATAAAAAITSAAFALPEIDHVEIHHDKANLASRRVPEKLGYELVAEVPDEALSPGDVGIDCTWSIGREDWSDDPAWPD